MSKRISFRTSSSSTVVSKIGIEIGRSKDCDRPSAQPETLALRTQMYCWHPRDTYSGSVDIQCVDRRPNSFLQCLGHGHVLEVTSDEDSDVHRICAALVRHRSSTRARKLAINYTLWCNNFMDQLTGVLTAISHPTRRAIFGQLANGPARFLDIAKPFDTALKYASGQVQG
jgi:hypothetical protein